MEAPPSKTAETDWNPLLANHFGARHLMQMVKSLDTLADTHTESVRVTQVPRLSRLGPAHDQFLPAEGQTVRAQGARGAARGGQARGAERKVVD